MFGYSLPVCLADLLKSRAGWLEAHIYPWNFPQRRNKVSLLPFALKTQLVLYCMNIRATTNTGIALHRDRVDFLVVVDLWLQSGCSISSAYHLLSGHKEDGPLGMGEVFLLWRHYLCSSPAELTCLCHWPELGPRTSPTCKRPWSQWLAPCETSSRKRRTWPLQRPWRNVSYTEKLKARQ